SSDSAARPSIPAASPGQNPAQSADEPSVDQPTLHASMARADRTPPTQLPYAPADSTPAHAGTQVSKSNRQPAIKTLACCHVRLLAIEGQCDVPAFIRSSPNGAGNAREKP